MRTEDDFIEWLQCATIYVGWARYGQFGGGFVCASGYVATNELSTAIGDLDAGDDDAMHAADIVGQDGYWYSADYNPAVAMAGLVEKMRRYYFDELNSPAKNS